MNSDYQINRKSYFIGGLLTFLVGPLGMFYISVAAGLGWTITALFIGLWTGGLGGIVVWLLSIPTCLYYVRQHNKMLDRVEEKETEGYQNVRKMIEN